MGLRRRCIGGDVESNDDEGDGDEPSSEHGSTILLSWVRVNEIFAFSDSCSTTRRHPTVEGNSIFVAAICIRVREFCVLLTGNLITMRVKPQGAAALQLAPFTLNKARVRPILTMRRFSRRLLHAALNQKPPIPAPVAILGAHTLGSPFHDQDKAIGAGVLRGVSDDD